MFLQSIFRRQGDIGVAVVSHVIEEIRYYQRSTAGWLEGQRASDLALSLLSRGRRLSTDWMRVVSNDVQAPPELGRYRAVYQGHSLALIFHFVS